MAGTPASMEGRAIARPNGSSTPATASENLRLQWRAEQLPGQTMRCASCSTWKSTLQWRAEQLPGQTSAGRIDIHPAIRASMEGRAIARPNDSRRLLHDYRRDASMEGRAIARPNPHRSAQAHERGSASMEGRPIARPNLSTSMLTCGVLSPLQWRAEQLPGQTGDARCCRTWCRVGFNGGPSNCPAKPARL